MTERKIFTFAQRQAIFDRDNRTCYYCKKKEPEIRLSIDHIIPLAKDGSNELTNIITACMGCNSGKKDRKTRKRPKPKEIDLSNLGPTTVNFNIKPDIHLKLKLLAIHDDVKPRHIVEKLIEDYVKTRLKDIADLLKT